MKTRSILLTLVLTGMACALNMDWSVIAGGGGTSTGGQYSLSGTIGQWDTQTQTLTGGQFAMQGGYWAGPEVIQTVGGPALSIAVTAPSAVTLTWPAPSTGWSLEHSLNLQQWSAVPTTPVVFGGMNSVTLTRFPGHEYFRLRRP